ncbi:hypothetical protein [Streptomyces hygroscopicus]|uniref:hypothetical protein n=1 Tax=Streptomyces hygroscopicus TaxID=1912 RepID=UPI0033EF2060
MAALTARHGGLAPATADVGGPRSVRTLLRPGDVLVTTVGPFERYGYPVAQAAAGQRRARHRLHR